MNTHFLGPEGRVSVRFGDLKQSVWCSNTRQDLLLNVLGQAYQPADQIYNTHQFQFL
jgi:hypothetical protein